EVVAGGPHRPAASHAPPAQGVPAAWSSHVAVQQESPGSHRSPAPASSTPSPQRECPAVKPTGFRRGLARTAKVPLMRAHVAASTCALSVALPGSPVHAGHVTTICVNRLRGLIRAVVVGQPLASVTCEPATVSTSVAGPPSRAMRGAVRRYRPSVQAASGGPHPTTARTAVTGAARGVRGRLRGGKGYVIVGTSVSGEGVSQTLGASEKFALRFPGTSGRDATIQLLTPAGRYFGPVVLRHKGSTGLLSLSGK